LKKLTFILDIFVPIAQVKFLKDKGMTKRNFLQLPGVALVIFMAFLMMGGLSSCTSAKKLAREKAAAQYAANVEQSKKDLTAMMNGTSTMTLDEQLKRLEEIKSYNIDDPQVKDLIAKVSDKLQNEKNQAERMAEEKKLQEQEAAKKQAEAAKFSTLNATFLKIAEAPSYDVADQEIAQALTLFSTSETPVLIIISQNQGFNDYDRPTTISRFLNYLKDMKAYHYQVSSVKRDATGKITELELINK
jgi:hypothetical protein